MKEPRLFALSTLLLPLLWSQSALGAPVLSGDYGAWDSYTEEATVTVGGFTPSPRDATPKGNRASDDSLTDRYQRHPICAEWVIETGDGFQLDLEQNEGELPACDQDYEIRDDFCEEGEQLLAPRWDSLLIDPEIPTYAPWRQISSYECSSVPVSLAAESAWRQMTITPQTVAVLPDQPWAITTVGVAANLDDSAQTTTVTVLGTDVVLRATPISNEWTVTDIVTGDSWPGVFDTASQGGHNVMVFERRQQRVHLGVTTTWEGHYSLNGGTTWVPAPGTATTTSDPLSMHVYHPRARLVNCDTTGDCMGGGVSSNPFTLTDPDADGIDNYLIPDHKISDYLNARADDRRWRDSERVNES